MDKDPLKKAMDMLARRPAAIKAKRCNMCDAEVKSFRDRESMAEYQISGLCQPCQDKVFTISEEG